MDKKNILNELKKSLNLKQLEDVYKKYVWKNWTLSLEFKKLKSMSDAEKKTYWKKLSDLRNFINHEYSKLKQKFEIDDINDLLKQDLVDASIDISTEKWYFSLLARVRREVEEICKSFWFIIEYWQEVVTKYENFESVNIPLTHPATEMHDTIYLNEKDNKWENFILRTHTSSMQNFLIKKHWLPIKVVVPARTYRFENMDATHDTMFYQMEWIYIDKNVSIANFKSLITKLLSAILHTDVEIRMRPWYFPFVEPWFEIDARYTIKDKKTWEEKLSDWVEIIWAWMVHPNVLKSAWVDPEQWRWFAFWIWISRIVAIRYNLKSIRYFTNWDLRFAKTFE